MSLVSGLECGAGKGGQRAHFACAGCLDPHVAAVLAAIPDPRAAPAMAVGCPEHRCSSPPLPPDKLAKLLSARQAKALAAAVAAWEAAHPLVPPPPPRNPFADAKVSPPHKSTNFLS